MERHVRRGGVSDGEALRSDQRDGDRRPFDLELRACLTD
jgi:hypothetical protein